MSLSISKFFQVKTVKMSDSFIITLRFPQEEESLVLTNCTGFSVPKIEYNEEIMYYGNVSQSFLIPKYDAIKEMSIKFLESQNDSILQKFIKNENDEKANSSFLNIGKGYALEQKRGKNSYSKNYGTYSINDFDLDELRIDIYDNNFNKIVYSYLFNNLKITKYEMYDLDYTNESPCEVSMTFIFEGYARGANLIENEKFKQTKQLPQDMLNSNQFASNNIERTYVDNSGGIPTVTVAGTPDQNATLALAPDQPTQEEIVNKNNLNKLLAIKGGTQYKFTKKERGVVEDVLSEVSDNDTFYIKSHQRIIDCEIDGGRVTMEGTDLTIFETFLTITGDAEGNYKNYLRKYKNGKTETLKEMKEIIILAAKNRNEISVTDPKINAVLDIIKDGLDGKDIDKKKLQQIKKDQGYITNDYVTKNMPPP